MTNENQGYEILEIPEEIHDLWRTNRAYESCKEVAIKSVFAASLAIKFAKKERECEQKAWLLIRELYYDKWNHGEKNFCYNHDNKELRYYFGAE